MKPVFLSLFLFLLFARCPAQSEARCFVCQGDPLTQELRSFVSHVEHRESRFNPDLISFVIHEVCLRLFMARAGLAPAVAGDTVHVRVSYPQLKNTLMITDSLWRRTYSNVLAGTEDSTYAPGFLRTYPQMRAYFALLLRHSHAAPLPEWTIVEVKAFVPVPLPVPAAGTGVIPSIPDNALWPIAAERDSLPAGKMVEGIAYNTEHSPVAGVLVYDTASAEVALTDREGYFRFWRPEPKDGPGLRTMVSHAYNSVKYDNINDLSLFLYGKFCAIYCAGSTDLLTYDKLLRRHRRRLPRNTCPGPATRYWKLELSADHRQAQGVIAWHDSTMRIASLPEILSGSLAGVWQAWGDSLLWQTQMRNTLLTAVCTETQTSTTSISFWANAPRPSWTGDLNGVYLSDYDEGIMLSVQDTLPALAISGIQRLHLTREHLYINAVSAALDRHDLIHQYSPQYDSVRQEWFLRTDSITWYYHKIGKYNWPALFSLTSVRTGLAPDGTSLCTDTLYATLKLVHLSVGPPAPEIHRQMVDLLHLPAAFPPVKEEFMRIYMTEP